MAYDYVVVGGGSAGCVLAARLSEDDRVRVLLLEAGARDPSSAPPAAWPTLLGTAANWADVSVPQRYAGGPVAVDQGRGLGGSSAINALAFIRGHRLGYERWAAAAPGWGWDDLLPWFRRSERAVGRDPAVRGQDGPMVVSPVAEPPAISRAFLDAAAETGLPLTGDPSAGTEEGFGLTDFTVVDGRRQSAADAYLRPVFDRPNLTVVTDATVIDLTIAAGRCTGVRYVTGDGPVDVRARAETILTAGAFGSPHLLMRSGVGPAVHLRDRDVTVLADRPEVGANLQDHPIGSVVYGTPDALPCDPALPAGAAHGLIRSELAGDLPDLQFIVLDVPFAPSRAPVPSRGFSIGFSAVVPRSRGTVRLAAGDPAARPVVDPRYFGAEADTAAMAAGLLVARRLGRTSALAPWHGEEVLPGPALDGDPAAAREYVRRNSGSYHHFAGTCRMGADGDSVVDLELRVRGIDGLRVADSSVLPSLPTANTNATVLAVAERAADLVLRAGA